MKITLKYLRKIINEELDRAVRWSAGFGGGGLGQGSNNSSLPGLGDEDEIDVKEKEYGEKEKSQQGAKFSSTKGGEDR